MQLTVLLLLAISMGTQGRDIGNYYVRDIENMRKRHPWLRKGRSVDPVGSQGGQKNRLLAETTIGKSVPRDTSHRG